MPQGINDMIMSSANTSSEALNQLKQEMVNDNTDFIMNTMQESETEESVQNQEALSAAVNDRRNMLKYLKMMRPKTLKREHKVGRNDPCPCGSGKKYKNCCLESGKYEKLSDK